MLAITVMLQQEVQKKSLGGCLIVLQTKTGSSPKEQFSDLITYNGFISLLPPLTMVSVSNLSLTYTHAHFNILPMQRHTLNSDKFSIRKYLGLGGKVLGWGSEAKATTFIASIWINAEQQKPTKEEFIERVT